MDSEYVIDSSITKSPEETRSSKRIRHDSGKETALCQPKVMKKERLKSVRAGTVVIKSKEMHRFLELAEDPAILKFLSMDCCNRIADKYLLAMVFTYFKRASFRLREFNRRNFFIALYLANDMEEDEEEFKYEIFPWALGYNWRNHYQDFWRRRDRLWKRMSYRAAVSKRCCDEIMALEPHHWLWSRNRPHHHGGAFRTPPDDDEDGYPRGPDASPRICKECDTLHQCSKNSPEAPSWYLTSSASSSPDTDPGSCCKSTRIVLRSWPNLEVLRKTLAAAEDDLWAKKEE